MNSVEITDGRIRQLLQGTTEQGNFLASGVDQLFSDFLSELFQAPQEAVATDGAKKVEVNAASSSRTDVRQGDDSAMEEGEDTCIPEKLEREYERAEDDEIIEQDGEGDMEVGVETVGVMDDALPKAELVDESELCDVSDELLSESDLDDSEVAMEVVAPVNKELPVTSTVEAKSEESVVSPQTQVSDSDSVVKEAAGEAKLMPEMDAKKDVTPKVEEVVQQSVPTTTEEVVTSEATPLTPGVKQQGRETVVSEASANGGQTIEGETAKDDVKSLSKSIVLDGSNQEVKKVQPVVTQVVSSEKTTPTEIQDFMSSYVAPQEAVSSTKTIQQSGSRAGSDQAGLLPLAAAVSNQGENLASNHQGSRGGDNQLWQSNAQKIVESSPKGEKSSVDRTRQQEMFERVRVALQSASQGKSLSTMVVRLDPPELGNMTVRVQQRGDQLFARIIPDSQEVESAIRGRTSEIASVLTQSGFRVDNIHVSVGLDDAQYSFGNLLQQQSQQSGQGKERRQSKTSTSATPSGVGDALSSGSVSQTSAGLDSSGWVA